MPKRSIWEATGLPDDVVWYAKRQRTSQLMDIMRRGVALIRKFLRPYYLRPLYNEEDFDPYGVVYWSASNIRRNYGVCTRTGDYKEGVVRDLTYTW